MKDCKMITKCLLCDSDTKPILSLGESPLANEFLTDIKDQDKFPLNLIQCTNDKCNHVQLDCLVDEERMYRNYLYVSGTSKVNVKHFKDYANFILDKYFTKPTVLPCNSAFARESSFDKYSKDLIIDIGSNDGTFLKNFTTIKALGVDPAENIAKEANKNGIKTLNAFWNEETVENKVLPYIKKNWGIEKAKVITANHIFAHNANIETIVKGVKLALSENGTFIFENSYLLDMVDKGIFDVIYHEHIHHHHLKPLINFFDKFDMMIYDAHHETNQHGGSIRVFVCNKSANFAKSKELISLIKKEESINEKLLSFKNKINFLKDVLTSRLKELKAEHKKIAVYGFPAKATTLCAYFNLDNSLIDFAVEDAPLKIGKFGPGTKIPILSTIALYTQKPDVVLVLAWNFFESIMENHKELKCLWITPLPKLIEVQK